MTTFKKAFIVETSELEGRIDPLYYKLYSKYNFSSVKLSKLVVDIFQGQVQGEEIVNDIKIIKVKNLDLFGNINLNDVTYVKNVSNRKILRYGDVITPFRGQTIFTNKFAFFDSNEIVTIDNNLGVIRLKSSIIEPKYFRYYISSQVGFNEILKNVGGASIPALTKDIIKNINVYLPPLKIQNKIISIMDNAYKIKKANEQKAKEILDSIDKFFLNELGIILTEEKKEISFQLSSSKIEGNLSPLFYRQNNSFSKEISFKKLKQVAFLNPSRNKGNYKESDLVDYVGLPQTSKLEINEIVKRKYLEVKGRKVIQNNDILFARIEPSIYNKKYILAKGLNNITFTSTEFYIIQAKKDVDYKYLFYILFHDVVFSQIKGKITGSTGRRRLDKDVFENLKIPLPPLETQTKIANHIQALREEAKQLQQEAKEVLASAKDEVEEIILGEK